MTDEDFRDIRLMLYDLKVKLDSKWKARLMLVNFLLAIFVAIALPYGDDGTKSFGWLGLWFIVSMLIIFAREPWEKQWDVENTGTERSMFD